MKTITIPQMIQILRDRVRVGPRYYGMPGPDEGPLRSAAADRVALPLSALDGVVLESRLWDRIESAERHALQAHPFANSKYLVGREATEHAARIRAARQSTFELSLQGIAELYASSYLLRQGKDATVTTIPITRHV